VLGEVVKWIVETVGDLGYIGIIFMMFLESSFFPFPSEVVMIPAGYLASKGEMSVILIIITGVIGSILGALLNYYLALKIGRKTLLKFGHYFFISKESIEKVEDFFLAHGKISTFTGRLIPGIRQLISLPAGIAKMDLKIFILYTSLGAGIWAIILTLLGYFIGENEMLLKEYLHTIITTTIILILIGISIYIKRHRK
jgi:membrane protein DedA with SNARE-associated domain